MRLLRRDVPEDMQEFTELGTPSWLKVMAEYRPREEGKVCPGR